MLCSRLLLAVTTLATLTCTHAKIGYFWHITDFHFDPLYSAQGDTRRHCHRSDDRGSSGHHRALGGLGDHACDSPLALIESAALHMKTRNENVEFVLWTGDIVSAYFGSDDSERLQAVKNMTDLLGPTFSSQFVFPALGHLDPGPSENLTALWQHWLPTEALVTFKDGGYYTIEQTYSKLRLVVLNTKLMSGRDAFSALARRQWDWLDGILLKAVGLKEMVYIVGHAPPGFDGRQGTHTYSAEANKRYLEVVRRHARVIAGQFFGHLHSDTFRVVYDKEGRPVSWIMMAPAVTPHKQGSLPSNPGLRLYKFDTNSGKVLDYTQYYLELLGANRGGPGWQPEYNLTQHYGLQEVSAGALHSLAEKLRVGAHEGHVFNKYLRASTARASEGTDCDSTCAHAHYCAVTCLDVEDFKRCVEAAASALASNAAITHISNVCSFNLLKLFILMSLLIFVIR